MRWPVLPLLLCATIGFAGDGFNVEDGMMPVDESGLNNSWGVPLRNLLPETEDFQTWWTATSVSMTDGALITPTGSADGQEWTSTLNTYSLLSTGAPTTIKIAAHNVFSVHFYKPSGTLNASMSLSVVAGGRATAWCTVVSASASNPYSSNVDDWGYSVEANGWVRVAMYIGPSLSADIGKTANFQIYVERSNSAPPNAGGVWGAQIEHGVMSPTGYQAVP